MLEKFNEKYDIILGDFSIGNKILEASRIDYVNHNDLDIIYEAKITETDDNILNDILENIKNTKNISTICYTYEKLLNISSSKTWRYFDYFKNSCLKDFKYYIFISDYKDVELFKKQYPSLISFFNRTGEGAFGITWPFNCHEVYSWLNKSLILNSAEPLKRIHHETIHAWTALFNVDDVKNFGKHDPENPIEKLNETQQKFIDLNRNDPMKGSFISDVNYVVGQGGLDFEAQVNDICDAIEYVYRKLIKNKDKNKWLDNFINDVNKNILNKTISQLLIDNGLGSLNGINIDMFYNWTTRRYIVLHGLLQGNNKLWYLDESLRTHFKEDVKDFY